MLLRTLASPASHCFWQGIVDLIPLLASIMSDHNVPVGGAIRKARVMSIGWESMPHAKRPVDTSKGINATLISLISDE